MEKYYNTLVEDLHTRILSQYPSVKIFCEKFDINRQNLSKVFNRHQHISLALYLRICAALGVLCPGHNIDFAALGSDFTLYQYFVLSRDSILYSMLEIIINPTGEKYRE